MLPVKKTESEVHTYEFLTVLSFPVLQISLCHSVVSPPPVPKLFLLLCLDYAADVMIITFGVICLPKVIFWMQMLEPFLSDLPVVKSSKEKAGSETTTVFTCPILLLQIPLCDPQVRTRIEEWKLNELAGRGRQAKTHAPSVEILLTVERFAAMTVTSVGLVGSSEVFRAWDRCPTISTVTESAGILLEKILFISFSLTI